MRGADRVPRQSVLDHRATRHVTPGLQARAAERFDETFGVSVPALNVPEREQRSTTLASPLSTG